MCIGWRSCVHGKDSEGCCVTVTQDTLTSRGKTAIRCYVETISKVVIAIFAQDLGCVGCDGYFLGGVQIAKCESVPYCSVADALVGGIHDNAVTSNSTRKCICT